MNVSRNTRDKEFHDCRAQSNATEDGKRSKQAVVRRVVLALMLWSVLPAQAATPVRLQVIPYQVNKQALPALPALLAPPPMITEQAQPRKRRPVQSRGWNSDDDFDWLMD